MIFYRKLLFFISGIVLFGCVTKEHSKKVIVSNSGTTDRVFETVSITLDTADRIALGDSLQIGILDAESGEVILSQSVDEDADGTPDVLLFQPMVGAGETKVFTLKPIKMDRSEKVQNCFSRFVPERTDDYAWENDRVAFRTFGPTAQKMVEDSVAGGTLASGIDAWLKRVDYSIINSWYKKYTSGAGTYHEDTGEGLDNFHVGSSRGVGGTALKIDSTYYFAKNFVSHQTLYNGPIRTSFVLTYADWNAAGSTISETKYISLDRGHNLSKFTVKVQGTDRLSAGLTLHENDGVTYVEEQEGWISYWQPHGDSELGSGIVFLDGQMVGHEKYVTDVKDQSNLFAHAKTNNGSVTFYAGFGWKKSGQFVDSAAWEKYLSDFADQLQNPLVVTIE